MEGSFFVYLQRLEMLVFFSGYPLVYYGVRWIAGNKPGDGSFGSSLISFLPRAYALLGTLYLGLLLKNAYPDFSASYIKQKLQEPYLVFWGLLSLLFWIPAFTRKPVYSLLHSLVFFFFLAKDISYAFFGLTTDNHAVHNDMNIYTVSILINLISLLFITTIFFLFSHFRKFFKP
ncbi:MAG TPA: hypothetical protein VII28_14460 [Puia sp.]